MAVASEDWSWMSRFLGPFLHPGGEALSRRLLELSQIGAAAAILDLGAGNGATLRLARSVRPHLRVVALDPQPLVRPSGDGMAVLRATGRDLPIRRATLDAVIAECALCLIRPLEGTLREAHRALRPSGRLVASELHVTEPIQWSSESLARWACVLDAPLGDEILEGLRNAGFTDVRLEDHSEALWEIEERVRRRADIPDLLAALASMGPGFSDSGLAFLRQVRRERDEGRLRYGIFTARKPRA